MKIKTIALLLASCATGPNAARPSDLIVCGEDEVVILDLRDASAPKRIWSWRAADRPELPEPFRKKFGTTDDCKPVDGGRKVLITSSGGAAALVERSTGRVLFHATAPNAHSAEVIPGDRVVVACSTHPAGNRLVLFDLSASQSALVPARPVKSNKLATQVCYSSFWSLTLRNSSPEPWFWRPM